MSYDDATPTVTAAATPAPWHPYGPSAGDVLGKIAEVRKALGNLKAKKKDGVKFKVRSAEELNDKLRPLAIEHGLLIYPVTAFGTGYAVEDGTLATLNLTLRIQALSDGSYIDIAGFGLGADSQDKAGGKAMTYGWKAALIQTFLAGGADDTDDTDTPIKGGVKAKTGRVKITSDTVKAELATLLTPGDAPRFRDVAMMASKLSKEEQEVIMNDFAAARQRLGLPARQAPSTTPAA